MGITKNKADIRLNSGDDLQIKLVSTWHRVGHIMEGSLEEIDNSVEITFPDGDSPEYPGKSKCKVMIVLGQVTDDMAAFLNTITKVAVSLYHYNGLGFNGKHQEIFIPELILYKKTKLDFKADTQQVFALEGSVWGQSGIAECTPDDDLPTDAYAAGASPVNSGSKYYVVMDTLAS